MEILMNSQGEEANTTKKQIERRKGERVHGVLCPVEVDSQGDVKQIEVTGRRTMTIQGEFHLARGREGQRGKSCSMRITERVVGLAHG